MKIKTTQDKAKLIRSLLEREIKRIDSEPKSERLNEKRAELCQTLADINASIIDTRK